MEEDSRLARASCMGVVEKMSGLGYTFHKRFLCLDEGVLSYYSKVPQQAEREGFDMNILKALAAKPKFAIEIKHIKTIRPADPALCEKKKKKYMFIIEFQKSLLMSPSKGDGDSSQSPDKGKDGMELEWVFAVQSESELSQWVSILECEREIEVQPEQQVQEEEEPPIFVPKRTSLTERFEVKSFPNHEKEYNRNFEKSYHTPESKNRRIRRGRRNPQDEIVEKPQEEEKNEMEKQLFEDFQFLNDQIPPRDSEVEQQQFYPTLELLNDTVTAKENEQHPQKPPLQDDAEEENEDSNSYKVRETEEMCKEISVNENNENEKMTKRSSPPRKIRNNLDEEEENSIRPIAGGEEEGNEPAATNSEDSPKSKPVPSVEVNPQNQQAPSRPQNQEKLNKDWEQKLNILTP